MTFAADRTGRVDVVVRGLTKTYQTRRRSHVALDNVDLEVGGGELVVLLGPSGCGKTTLLRCIAGLEIPDRGDILINGRLVFSAEKRVNIPPEDRQLGMVFQSYALWPNMSVFENVAYPLRCGPRLKDADLARRVREALHRVGLETQAESYPGQLSGGQQQRVSLARALVADRKLVLFDEPLSNLDAKVRERLRIELLELQRDVGFTAIYVTHDQVEALALADRIAVMDVGHMAQIGTPNDVYARPSSRYVAHFVGNANEFQGRIISADGDRCKIATSLGTLSGVRCGETLAVGQDVAVVVRPENCQLSRESSAAAVPCIVKETMFLGSYVQCVLKAGDQVFSATAQGEAPPDATALFVTFDPDLSSGVSFGASGMTIGSSASLRESNVSLLGILVIAALTLLLFLFAYPMIVAAIRAIDELPSARDELVAALSNGTLQRVLGNTLIVVGCGAAIATVFGTALAYINERTDANMGLLGELLPLAPLLVPSIAGVIGWAVLLDPRAGLINSSLRTLLAATGSTMRTGPFNIYSTEGLVVMTGIYLVPYVYLVVAAALRHLDPSIEEASRVAGAGPLRTLTRVTLPSIRPAITGALLIAVVAGVGMFSVPIVLGTAARVEVISVYLFRLLDSYPPHTAFALALSAILVIGVQILLFVQRFATAAGRHAAVGGRGLRSGIRPLGRWKAPARLVLTLYIAITSILPVAGLLLVSLQSFWTPDIKWNQLSLANYSFVLLENGPTSRALITSIGLGAVTASVAMLAAGTILLFLRFNRAGLARIADTIMSLPATVPHTVIGATFLVSFSAAPFRLYGTLSILFLAYLLMAMPFAARAAATAASAIAKELVEASRVAGAREARTLTRVLLPIALPGLLAGWIIVFIHTVGEVTASSLLAGARNPVIGRAITELWIFGNFPQVAALSLLVTIVTSILVGLLLLISRRNAASTLG